MWQWTGIFFPFPPESGNPGGPHDQADQFPHPTHSSHFQSIRNRTDSPWCLRAPCASCPGRRRTCRWARRRRRRPPAGGGASGGRSAPGGGSRPSARSGRPPSQLGLGAPPGVVGNKSKRLGPEGSALGRKISLRVSVCLCGRPWEVGRHCSSRKPPGASGWDRV